MSKALLAKRIHDLSLLNLELEFYGDPMKIRQATTYDAAPTCEFGMSILAAYRIKGIGRCLIHLLDWAITSHINNVELTVFSNNHAAIALYASFGFVEDWCRKNAVNNGIA